MNDARYIYAADRLDAAHRAVAQALTALRTLDYQPVAVERALRDVARWRKRLASDRIEQMRTG